MSAVLQIIFFNLFEISLTASIIVVLLIFLRRWGRKWITPTVMSWLWLILVVKLILPIPVPTPFNVESFSDPFLFDKPYINEALSNVAESWYKLETSWRLNTITSLSDQANLDPSSLDMVAKMKARNQVINGIGFIWLMGFSVGLMRMWRQQRKSKRVYGGGVICQHGVTLELLLACKQQLRLKRNVKLKVSGTLSPVLMGWLKPTILLPYDYLDLYSMEELRYILLHELEHVKHKDVIRHLVSCWIEIVFWFQPLIMWGMRQLRKDIELSCDARVLKQLKTQECSHYGLLLIKQGQYNDKMYHTYEAGVYWRPKQSQLAERVEEISKQLHQSSKYNKRKGIRNGVFIIIMALLLLPISPTYANVKQYFDATPTCYVFWLENGINPKALSSIETMSSQIAGLSGDDDHIKLLVKQNVEYNWFIKGLVELWPIAMLQAQQPTVIATQNTLNQLEHKRLTHGQVVFMVQHHYTTTKLSSFAGGQIKVVNVSDLKVQKQVTVY
ncbi:beta-lactamase regulating signal transducer with metallopeptidase domain [Paenibacillus turicensis]|uniref:Beta-lactamase regulating signal transducer with metallopeptidase domain n=1 Tax=Paenibacillus turicensis TaxID=160487 RepID=A0ABS4FTK5_9BACL|nr:M56 family metallopeptidase [Paenibacillus turicensis]MBP1905912.1 beta-lactamase regulating signal transducer with metallopeptidase domain [Paenibacillus turicensis]